MARDRPSRPTMNAECQVTSAVTRNGRTGSPLIALSRVNVIQQSTPNSRSRPAACPTFSRIKDISRLLSDQAAKRLDLPPP